MLENGPTVSINEIKMILLHYVVTLTDGSSQVFRWNAFMQLKQLKTTNDKVDFQNRTALAWTNYCYTKPVNIFFFALGLAIPILKLGIVFYIHLHFQLRQVSI